MRINSGKGDSFVVENAFLEVPIIAHHLVQVIYTEEATGLWMKTYLDGQLYGTLPWYPVTNMITANPINIGQDGEADAPWAADFLIDDLGMWGRALTEAEVAVIHGTGLQGLDLTHAGPQPAIQISVAGLPEY